MESKYERLRRVGIGSYVSIRSNILRKKLLNYNQLVDNKKQIKGIVFKCVNRQTGQIVAIKRYSENDSDPIIRKIAMREVQMLRQLKHQNLINLIEVFRRKRRLHLVFDYCELTLLDVIEKYNDQCPLALIKRIIWQTVNAIDYCHSHKCIHRDIKPENILICQSGIVKLCDFGFARSLTAATSNSINNNGNTNQIDNRQQKFKSSESLSLNNNNISCKNNYDSSNNSNSSSTASATSSPIVCTSNNNLMITKKMPAALPSINSHLTSNDPSINVNNDEPVEKDKNLIESKSLSKSIDKLDDANKEENAMSFKNRRNNAHGSRVALTEYVATRWYRAPELLIGDVYYDTKIDIWAIGCVTCEMMRGEPIWPGKTDYDQLTIIKNSLGGLTKKQSQVLSSHAIYDKASIDKLLAPQTQITDPVDAKIPSRMGKSGADFVMSCLKIDQDLRSASDILLRHPFIHSSRVTQFVSRSQTQTAPRTRTNVIGNNSSNLNQQVKSKNLPNKLSNSSSNKENQIPGHTTNKNAIPGTHTKLKATNRTEPGATELGLSGISNNHNQAVKSTTTTTPVKRHRQDGPTSDSTSTSTTNSNNSSNNFHANAIAMSGSHDVDYLVSSINPAAKLAATIAMASVRLKSKTDNDKLSFLAEQEATFVDKSNASHEKLKGLDNIERTKTNKQPKPSKHTKAIASPLTTKNRASDNKRQSFYGSPLDSLKTVQLNNIESSSSINNQVTAAAAAAVATTTAAAVNSRLPSIGQTGGLAMDASTLVAVKSRSTSKNRKARQLSGDSLKQSDGNIDRQNVSRLIVLEPKARDKNGANSKQILSKQVASSQRSSKVRVLDGANTNGAALPKINSSSTNANIPNIDKPTNRHRKSTKKSNDDEV